MAKGNDKGKQARQVRSAMVRLHRWVGLFSFVVLLGIVVTGVVLNHGVDLDLDERTVAHPEVLRWYGMEPEGEPLVFEAGGVRIAGWDGSIFFDGDLMEVRGELVGATPLTGEFAIVCREAIFLVDREGKLLERVSAALLPEDPMEAVARLEDGELVLRAAGKDFLFRPGIGVEDWEGSVAVWIEATAAEGGEREAILALLRGEGLPLSRVMLDLHSGRIFGPIGVLIYDVAAIAVILLSATGLWLAVRNFYRSARRS